MNAPSPTAVEIGEQLRHFLYSSGYPVKPHTHFPNPNRVRYIEITRYPDDESDFDDNDEQFGYRLRVFSVHFISLHGVVAQLQVARRRYGDSTVHHTVFSLDVYGDVFRTVLHDQAFRWSHVFSRPIGERDGQHGEYGINAFDVATLREQVFPPTGRRPNTRHE